MHPTIIYPTIEQVKEASHTQLAIWYRFLPSPGSTMVGKDGFKESLKQEAETIDLIVERFREMGGFTPELSKKIDRFHPS